MIDIVIPVYRDAPRVIDLVASLASQRLSTSAVSSVLVIDDGSGDLTADQVERALADRVRLIRLPENRGRAQARNAGAAVATAELLMFLDCDSHPTGPDLLELHWRACTSGHVASCGPVHGEDDGFWARYQAEAMRRRELAHARGETFAGSAANLMVGRRAFEEVGGFDPAFRGYGFEDRDLLIRLSRLGKIAWTREAAVVHTAALNMRDVSRKMVEAGGASAEYFSHRHPDEYLTLGYSRLDTRLHRGLHSLAPFVTVILPKLVSGVDVLLRRRRLPFALKAVLVRLVTALSFLSGTARV